MWVTLWSRVHNLFGRKHESAPVEIMVLSWDKVSWGQYQTRPAESEA